MEINKHYLDWIGKSPSPLPFFQKQVEDLIVEKMNLEKQLSYKYKKDLKKDSSTTNAPTKYNAIKNIDKGEAFIDGETGLIIGVVDISVDYKSDLQITFPDKSSRLMNVSVGANFTFKYNGKSYNIVIKKIDFVYGYVSVQIFEK